MDSLLEHKTYSSMKMWQAQVVIIPISEVLEFFKILIAIRQYILKFTGHSINYTVNL